MEEKIKVFRKNSYDKGDSSLAFLFACVVPLIISFILIFVINIFTDLKSVQGELWYLILSALITPLTFLVTPIFINKTEKIPFKTLKIQKINIKNIIFCIIIALICFFGLYNFIDLVNLGLEKIGYDLSSISLPLTNGWYLVLNLFLLGVLPAIFEEVVFRGIIFQGLRKEYGDIVAVFFSAFLFAIIHGSLAQFVYPFVMGIVFATLFLRTGSLISSMIVHLTNNFLVIIFSYIQLQTGFSLSLQMDALGIVLAVLIAMVAILILLIIDKFVFKRKTKEEFVVKKEPTGEKNIMMYVAIGIAVALFLINTISAFA